MPQQWGEKRGEAGKAQGGFLGRGKVKLHSFPVSPGSAMQGAGGQEKLSLQLKSANTLLVREELRWQLLGP